MHGTLIVESKMADCFTETNYLFIAIELTILKLVAAFIYICCLTNLS